MGSSSVRASAVACFAIRVRASQGKRRKISERWCHEDIEDSRRCHEEKRRILATKITKDTKSETERTLTFVIFVADNLRVLRGYRCTAPWRSRSVAMIASIAACTS